MTRCNVATWFNENDPFAAAWLQQLYPDAKIDQRSIVDVKPEDTQGNTRCHFFGGIGGWEYALSLAGWPAEREVWTGSCPCQPFSEAGKRTGESDARHLWPEFRRLIAERKPATIFGEQVASRAGRAWLSAVRADLEALGYAVGAADLCAAGVGAPQIRQRLWWVADADYTGWQRAKRQGQPYPSRPEWPASCSEPVRSMRGPWPPGPGAVNSIPQLVNGLPGTMGGCKGYGNAIVPECAAAFVKAYLEATCG